MKNNRLRSKLTTVQEPVTDRHFTDIVVQGLPENYHIKYTTYKDPDFNLIKIQATMKHVHLDGLLRKKTITGRDTIMTAATASGPVVTCHNCAVPGKVDRQGKTPTGKKAGSPRGGAGQKWCSVHKATSHSDTELYVQVASRPETSSTAAVLSVKTDEKCTINLNDDLILAVLALETSTPKHQPGSMSKVAIDRWSITSTISTQGHLDDGSWILKKTLEVVGKMPSRTDTVLSAETIGAA